MFNKSNTVVEVDGEKINVHNRVVGDVSKVKKSVTKNGFGIINSHKKVELKYLKPSDLTPIDTQRDTNATWAETRLKDLRGLDCVAFGALSVGYDSENDTYWLFDGCGRDLLASVIDSEMEVPCLVWPLTQKEAAFYFSYNQDKGRRKLPKESIFVNSWFHGDQDAVKWANRLQSLGLKISANPDFNAPYGHTANTPVDAVEISEKGIKEAWEIAKQPTPVATQLLIQEAKDIIFDAFSRENQNGKKVLERLNGELLWAFLMIFKTYKNSMSGELNLIIKDYLRIKAELGTQNDLVRELKALYSIPGMNKSQELTSCLAYALVSEIRNTKRFKEHEKYKTLKGHIVLNKITTPTILKRLGS